MKRWRIVLAIWLVAAASACSSHNSPSDVSQTEEMLTDAGFNPVVLQSPDEIAIANTLPKNEMHYYDTISGPVYWYYDPDGCGCVYVGGGGDFDRYQMAEKSDQDVDAYLAESQDTQVASLFTINPLAFPAPYAYASGVAFNFNGGLYSWWPHPPPPHIHHGPIVGSGGGTKHPGGNTGGSGHPHTGGHPATGGGPPPPTVGMHSGWGTMGGHIGGHAGGGGGHGH